MGVFPDFLWEIAYSTGRARRGFGPRKSDSVAVPALVAKFGVLKFGVQGHEVAVILAAFELPLARVSSSLAIKSRSFCQWLRNAAGNSGTADSVGSR